MHNNYNLKLCPACVLKSLELTNCMVLDYDSLIFESTKVVYPAVRH
jgi:hypothetical protein